MQRNYLQPIERLLKNGLRATVSKLGYELVRRRKFGTDAFQDIKQLTTGQRPVIADVGANRGQSMQAFKRILPKARVHSFEPAPDTFAELKQTAAKYRDVFTNQLALGSHNGRATLHENSHSKMTSLLKPGEACWGKIVAQRDIEVRTLDEYCQQARVPYIDVLKTDTQGFDLEVLRGAEQLLQNQRIGIIYCEVIFSKMYDGIPSFDEHYRYLHDHGFRLVTFYRFSHRNNLANWSDALFVHPQWPHPQVRHLPIARPSLRRATC